MESFITLAISLFNFILHIDVHLQEIMANYGTGTYVVLFLIVFAETGLVVTPFLPGDSLLFAAGAIAALGGLNIGVLLAVLIFAAVLGDAVNYHVGKYLGPKVLTGNLPLLKREHLEKTQRFYGKYGVKTIILARFVPIVRTFAPFMAGVGSMHYGRFFIYNVAGGTLWVLTCTMAGHFFGNIPLVKNNFGLVVIGVVFVSVLPILFEVLAQRRKGPSPE